MADMTSDFTHFIDEEISRREERAGLLIAGIEAGIKDFQTFRLQPLLLGLDFVTVSSAWEQYQKRECPSSGASPNPPA